MDKGIKRTTKSKSAVVACPAEMSPIVAKTERIPMYITKPLVKSSKRLMLSSCLVRANSPYEKK